jgi:putative phage-type endonuclease
VNRPDRKTYLGASEIGAVVGLSPWTGPHEVWLRKTGRVEDQEDNLAIWWGNAVEPLLATRYSMETHREIVRGTHLVHPKYPMIGGTPDRLDEAGRRVVELKTANLRQAIRWGAEGSDEIPEEYVAQTTLYMELADFDVADVALLLAGNEFRIYTVQRDRELAGQLLEAGAKFWRDYVLADKPPPIDGSDGAREMLRALYPRSTEPLKTANAHIESLALTYSMWKRDLEEHELKLAKVRQELEAFIADSVGVEGAFGRITFKQAKDSEKVDWRAVAMALNAPKEVIASCTSIVPGSRRFLVRPAKFTPTPKENTDG